MQDSDVIFEWKTHPLRESPRRARMFIFSMTATLIVVWWSFRNVGWILVAAMLVGGSLHRFWLPARYRISDNEIEIREGWMPVKRRLTDFRRVAFDPRGAFLSPFDKPNRLERYRGMYLPLPVDSEPIRSFLRNRFSEAVSDA